MRMAFGYSYPLHLSRIAKRINMKKEKPTERFIIEELDKEGLRVLWASDIGDEVVLLEDVVVLIDKLIEETKKD